MSDQADTIKELRTELARCEADADRAAKTQAALYEVADAASASPNMHEFYAALHRIVGELMYARNFFIAEYDEVTGMLSFPYFVDEADATAPVPEPMQSFRGATGYVMRTGQLSHYRRNGIELLARGEIEIVGTPSEDSIFVPLKSGDHVLGALAIQIYQAGIPHYTEQDEELLAFVAQHVAQALTRARALEETRQRNSELQIINSVQEGLASKLDMQAIYDLVGNTIQAMFDVAEVEISSFDPASQMISFPYWSSRSGRIMAEPLPLGIGLNSIIIETRQPLLLTNEAQIIAKSAVVPEGYWQRKSFVGAPIISAGRVIGAISLHDEDREDAYDASVMSLLTTLANSMGVALENARLFDETQNLFKAEQQRAAELAIITSIQEGLASQLDMPAIYELVGDRIRDVFPHSNVGIRIYDRQAGLVHYPYFYQRGTRFTLPSDEFDSKGFQAHVLSTGQTLLINENIAQRMEQFGSNLLPGAVMPKSQVYVPLLVGGVARGLLTLDDVEREGAFSPSDVRLLETIAGSTSVALENARLFDETQRLFKAEQQRAAELAIINSVQEGLASKLDFQAIINLVGEKVGEIFKADTVYIAQFDAAQQLFRFPYYVDKGYPTLSGTLPLGQGLTSVIFRTRQPLVLGTGEEQLRQGGSTAAYETVSKDQNRSYLGVPILLRGEVTGVLSVQKYEEHAFAESDARLLATLANSMSVALENARLFDETQRLFKAEQQRAAELAIINSVQGALAEKLDLQAIYEIVGDKVQEIFNAQAVIIVSYDEVEGRTKDRYLIENGVRFQNDERELNELHLRIIRERKPLVFNENALEELTKLGANNVPGTEPDRSAVFVPLLAGNRVSGSISLHNVDVENAFGESDVRLLQTLASSMSVALENARLFDETQRLFKAEQQRAAELAIINSVQEGLASKLNMQAIYDLVGEKVRTVFDAQVVSIFTYDRNTDVLTDQYEFEKGDRTRLPEPLPSFGFRKHVIETRQPLVINKDVEQATKEFGNPILSGAMPRANIFVPMIAGAEVTGIISLQNLDHENAFSEADVRLLQTLANSMSVALENARLFDEVQKRNQEITEALEQQTATTDILRVIAGSPSDIQPVMDVIAEHAMRLCEGINSSVYLTDGKLVYEAVSRNARPEALELNRTEYPRPLAYDSSLSSRAILGKAVLNIADSQNDPTLPELTREYSRVLGMKSILFVPLLKDGEARGALAVSHGESGLFSEKHVALLKTFADQAVIAIENVRLFNETKRLLKETEQRAAELAIINSVQEGLASKLDMQAIYDLVGEKIREIFHADTTYICSYESDKQLVYSHFYVDGEQRLPPQSLRLGEGMYSRVIQTRRPVLIQTGQEEEAQGSTQIASPGSEEDLNQAALYVPIMLRDEVKGVVSVQSHKQYAYTENDSRLLSTLASSLGVALENARLFDEVQKRNQEITEALEQQTATSEILRVIASSPTDIQPVLDAVAESAARLCDSYDAAIARVEGDVYKVVSQWGPVPLPEENIKDGIPLNRETVTGRAILEKRSIHVDDVLGEPPSEYPRSKEFSWISGQRTLLATPLMREGRAIGAIFIRRQEVNPFTDKQAGLLKIFADQAAIAIENVRLFNESTRLLKETEQRAAELAIINSVQEGLASKLDMQAIYDLVGEEIRTVFDAQVVSILTYDRLTDMLADRYEFEKGDRSVLPEPMPSFGFRKHVIQTRQPIVINRDMEKAGREYGNPVLSGEMPKAAVFVPMVAGSEVTGILSLQNVDHEDAFGEADVRLLQTVARSMSVALENARLFDETQRLLKETEQRAAELAIINSVQEGLASKLDMQAIYDLVGDKIRDVFDAQAVLIDAFDHAKQTDRLIYGFENGQRIFDDEARPFPPHVRHLIEKRRPIVIDHDAIEVGKQYGVKVVEGTEASKSLIFVPFGTAQQVNGYFSLQNLDREYAFSASDVRLLQTLAGSMGIALENARLFDETQRLLKETEQRAAELAVINSVQQGLASKLDMQAIYDLVGDKIRDIFQTEVVYIAIRNAERAEQFDFPYYLDRGVRLSVEPVTLGQGITSRVIESRQAVIAGSMKHQIELGGIYDDAELSQSYLGVPIFLGDEVMGVASVQSYRTVAFGDAHVRLLTTLAASMGVALENARLFDETQRLLKQTDQRAAELAIINSVQEGLASKLDMQAIYDLVGDKIRDVFDAQTFFIARYDPETNLVRWPYYLQRGQRIVEDAEPLGRGLTSHILQTRQPLVLNESAVQRGAELGAVMVDANDFPQSFLGVPIIVGDQATGAISLQNMEREHAFPDSDVNLLTTLAASLGVALENARLFDETQRLLKETDQRAAELAIINSVQEGLASKLEMQAIYDLVGDKIRDVFDSQAVTIALYDRRNNILQFPYYLHRGQRLAQEPISFGEGLTSHVIRSRQPLLINQDAEKRYAELGAVFVAGDDNAKSWLGVPITSGPEATGAIFLQNYERQNAYTEADVRLLSTIATSMGVALENARLFDETQRLLKETDQRAAELQIINTVQEGLAVKLDAQAIYELVGDKIGEIHPNVDVGIRIHDPHTNLIHYPYIREKGKRIEIPSRPTAEKGFVAHVLRTRQVLLINEDMAARQEEYGSWVLPGTEMEKSAVYAPVFIGGQARGVVSLGSSERENAFSDADVRLLQTLAGSMGIALEKAGLFEAERKRAAELSAISTVSQALVAETELDSMVQLIGKQLREIFSADIVYVALLNRQTNLIEFPYQFGEEIAPRRLGEGLTSKIIETRQPVLINQDVDNQLAGLGAKKVGVEARSYLGVPILAGRQAIGVISVQSTKEENAFNQDDVRLLSTIAANAGSAIQTARLHAETQRRAQEMATLAEIGNDIAASRELEPVLERIALHAKEILNVRDIAIRLLDTDGRTLSAAVALGTDAAEYKAVVLKMGEGLTGAIAASGVAEFVNDPARDPRVVHVPGTPVEEDAHEGMMVAPLISRGQTIGVIGVWRPHEAGLFTQAELDFLVSVARQTAIAIESARLYLETQRRANEMSALTEVGREISASLDPAVVLNLIASRARELLSADTSAVYLMDADRKSLRAVTAIGNLAEDVKSDRIKLGEGIIGSLAQESKAEFVNDAAHDPRAVDIPGTAEIPNERLMAAPLLKADEVVGMLAVWRGADPFTEADLNFLAGLARQASIGHENARLFAEIRAEKQYSEALVQNSPVAIMSIDTDASVVAWNPGAEKLFGYSAEEAIGRNIDDLVANHPGIREEAGGFFTQLGRAEQIHAITKRTRKDGTFVDVEVSGVPVVVDGKHEGLIGIYHDITELQRARQEAVAANEAKSAFLATMSHEIRTPMNAVIGMSGLLMDTELNKEQFDYAETIRNSGDALLAIINDILDFSKIEAGKMELEHQPFDLRECVESALDLVAGRAVEKRIDLAYIIDDEVPLGIKGDVTRLRQILLNLMSNAVKFTEKGEVVLTVKKDKVANHLLIAVRDTGIGIPADRMGRLFESFSQADSSTTRRFGGTGLGLVISKRLAEMMGGRMWAESAGAGKGSTFSFTMQVEAAHVAERRTARDIKGIQPSLAGKRVLIVDDNATNRRILMLQTQKWGMAPRETESPRQALKWLKTDEAFDLAVLDVQMPEMDGLMLTRELRKLEYRAALPIILLTSLGRKEIGAEALDFAAYLSKPLKPSALFDALAGIFARNIVTPKAQPAKASMDDELGKRHPLRILLAEDNAVNQKLALRLLEQMGYRADVASNGLEAVESLERQAYDVILMDVQMPEMDGLDATRAIRKLTNVTQPRVVAMTANAMQGDREMCLAAGMDDYVSKPIRVAELKEALEKTKSLAAASSSRPRQAESDRATRKKATLAKKAAPGRAKIRARSALKTGKK